MAIQILLATYPADPPSGTDISVATTLYHVLADSLPDLTWELSGDFSEVTAGDLSFTARNDSGWWDSTFANYDHTVRYGTAGCLTVYVLKEGIVRWEGDLDPASVRFDRKADTVSMTFLGKLKRLERYSAETVRRAIPTYFDTGVSTAIGVTGGYGYIDDTTQNWTADALINHCVFTKWVAHCHDADVSSANDTCTITAHGLDTGDVVTYVSSNGNVITGLSDAGQYYVVRVDANTIKLANSYANAITNSYIGLTKPGGGDRHDFIFGVDKPYTITDNTATRLITNSPWTPYDAQTYRIRPYAMRLAVLGSSNSCADAGVDAGDNHVTTGAHGLETGDAVEYYCSDVAAGSGFVVSGLTNHTTYWAQVINSTDFRLQTTKELAEAIAGASDAINLAQPNDGATHYFIHNRGARVLEQNANCPTSTVALLHKDDVLRLVAEAKSPIHSFINLKSRATWYYYDKYDFDYTDAKVDYVGPLADTVPPGVTVTSSQVIVDTDIEVPHNETDGVYCLTPYYRDITVESLVRKLFLAAGVTERELVINLNPFHSTQTIPYADMEGKSVAEALTELAQLCGATLWATPKWYYFVSRNVTRSDATLQTISGDDILEDSEGLSWENSVDYVSVTGPEDREVRRGRYTPYGTGFEVSTEYDLRYKWLRQIADGLWRLLGGRRKTRDITLAKGTQSATTDYGAMSGTSGEALVNFSKWTGWTGAGDAHCTWLYTTLSGKNCGKATPDQSGWHVAAFDDAGQVQNADVYCEMRLPTTSTATDSKAWLIVGAGSATFGGALALRLAVTDGLAVCELNTVGSITVHETYAATVNANTWYKVRFRVYGYHAYAKVWGINDVEPADWQIDHTMTTIPPIGYCGLMVYKYETPGDPIYYFANLRFVGVTSYEMGYNVGDRLSISSTEWWVTSVSEPLRALTYPSQIKLGLVSAVAEDEPLAPASFDGSYSYVDVGDVCNMTTKFTIEFWVLIPNYFGADAIISKSVHHNTPPTDGWLVRQYSSAGSEYIRLTIPGLTAYGSPAENYDLDVSSLDLPNPNDWHHFAFTVNTFTGVVIAYIDGVDSSQIWAPFTGTATDNAYYLKFGKYHGSRSYMPEMYLREVRIWDTDRTAAQIGRDYNLHLRGDEPGLIGYWRLDEGFGCEVHDATPLGDRDGIFYNARWIQDTNDASRTVAKPEPPVIESIAAAIVTDRDMQVYVASPSERVMGFIITIWDTFETRDNYQLQWAAPYTVVQSATGNNLQDRYTMTLDSTYDGCNVDVQVICWDGNISDPSDAVIIATYP